LLQVFDEHLALKGVFLPRRLKIHSQPQMHLNDLLDILVPGLKYGSTGYIGSM
jgi:hypothetical protein